MFLRPSTLLRATFLLSLAASALLVAACDITAWGNGDAETDDRALDEFTAIELRAPIDVTLEVAAVDPDAPPTRTPTQPSARLRCDSNLLHRIDTHVDNGTLHVEVVDAHVNLHPRVDCELVLTTRRLDAIEISGPGTLVARGTLAELRRIDLEGPAQLDVDGIAVTTLEVDVEGPGELVLAGMVERLEADLEGPAQLDAASLVAKTVVLDAEGPVGASVRASDRCELDIEGPANIDVFGDPRSRDVDAEGPTDIRFH